MPLALASLVLDICGVYLGAGVLFALAFLVFGLGRVDAASHGATAGFRLVILPGVIPLWPYLAWRWLRAWRGPPVERSPHIRASERRP